MNIGFVNIKTEFSTLLVFQKQNILSMKVYHEFEFTLQSQIAVVETF